MPLKAFISYSSKDMPIVEQIQKTIKASDIDVFVAKDSIKPGESLNDSIIKNIKESDLFILLWSKNADKSAYVKQEIGIATGANKQIIPFVLDKRAKLPAFVGENIKHIPAYENLEKSIEALKRTTWGKAAVKQTTKENKETIIAVGLMILLVIFIFLASRE